MPSMIVQEGDHDVIFVQSKIRETAKDTLSPSLFKTWYEEAHIPDLLGTPGVSAALRYVRSDIKSPEDEASAVGDPTSGFPYLCVYSRIDYEWVHSESCEFVKVPLTHEMLPGPRGAVFEVADFVMGAYEVMHGVKNEGNFDGPPKHIVAVPLDITAVQGVHRGEILQRSWEMLGRPAPSSSSMLWYDMSPAGQEPRRDEIGAGRVFVGESFVILHEVDEVPHEVSAQWGKTPFVYNLIRAFGDARAGV